MCRQLTTPLAVVGVFISVCLFTGCGKKTGLKPYLHNQPLFPKEKKSKPDKKKTDKTPLSTEPLDTEKASVEL